MKKLLAVLLIAALTLCAMPAAVSEPVAESPTTEAEALSAAPPPELSEPPIEAEKPAKNETSEKEGSVENGAPAVTVELTNTEEPTITEEPANTEDAAVTEEPANTEDAAVTVEPANTEDAAVTVEPANTEEPAEDIEGTPDSPFSPKVIADERLDVFVSADTLSWNIEHVVNPIIRVVWNPSKHEYEHFEDGTEERYLLVGDATRTFTLNNRGNISADWRIEYSGELFSVSNAVGTLSPRESQTISVTLQTAGLEAVMRGLGDGLLNAGRLTVIFTAAK